MIEQHNPKGGSNPVTMVCVDEIWDASLPQAQGEGCSTRLKPDGIGFILHCDRKGVIKEVIQDGLGLGSRLGRNVELTSVVSPFHFRRVNGFLRSVGQNRSSYDCALSILGPSGLVRLYCSAFLVGHDIVVIATAKPLSRSVPHERASRRRILELAAHDLLNPISGIWAACQYLLEDAAGALEPHQMLVLSSIESSTRLALQLIQNLAEITSVLMGPLEMDLRGTDIVSVLKQAVSATRDLANIRNVEVEITVKDQIATLRGDPIRLGEAFYGLIVTAIGAQSAGRIEIVIGRRDGEGVIELNREYAPAVGASAPDAGSSSLLRVPRKLSDVHAGLLLERSKRILKAHGGTLRSEMQGEHARSWTIALPMAGERSTRKQTVDRYRRRVTTR